MQTFEIYKNVIVIEVNENSDEDIIISDISKLGNDTKIYSIIDKSSKNEEYTAIYNHCNVLVYDTGEIIWEETGDTQVLICDEYDEESEDEELDWEE